MSDMLTDPGATNSLTRQVIGCAIRVHRTLGPGLLESAYQACLARELTYAGLHFEQEYDVPLLYRDIRISNAYRLDLLVEARVIIEIKSVEALTRIHEAQMLTYLKLTRCPVGLLINFNVSILRDGIRRIVNAAP